jgi:hypothetical protein
VDGSVCRIERDQYCLREPPGHTLRSGPLGSQRGERHNPEEEREYSPRSKSRLKQRTQFVIANNGSCNALQTVMPTASAYSDNQLQISECPWL